MDNSNFRFYIKVRTALGIYPKSIHKELKNGHPEKVLSYMTVTRWSKLFKSGKSSIQDKPRSGRPIVKTIPDNIELVRNVIEEDPYATYDEIEEATTLSRGVIQTIIHDHLKLRKVTSRWVPHFLTEQNRRDRVEMCKKNLDMFQSNKWRLYDVVTGDEAWFYLRQIGRKKSNASWIGEGESPRTVVRLGKFEQKSMFTIFFKSDGVVHISYLDKGETIDHKKYLTSCLKPLVSTLNKRRPISGTKNLKFHHDNARPHVHKSVITYLKSKEFIIMDHPPYSPDLAPSDFWLFDYIKQRLYNHTTVESLATQIVDIVNNIPQYEYKKTFEKWLERMELCIKYKGDYFEHIYNKD